MKAQTNVGLVAIAVFLFGLTPARGELSYSVTDLGTLGGNASTANSVAGHGMNAAGMIVGSSTTSDNSEHAFLYANDQMFDLNTLCDLSQSDFKVLTVARTISDSCIIIGDGITTNGDKHAFMLTPLTVAGGQWYYQCCQWVWIQEGGGWWWEENCGCYRWHGPPGRHPPCPPQPPPCWRYPLPCPPCPPPCKRPTPTPTPTPPWQTPTPPGQTPTPTLPPPVRRTPTPPNWTPTPPITYIPGVVQPTPTPTYTGIPVLVKPTPTPAGRATSTPSRRRRGSPTPPKTFIAKPQTTASSSRRGTTIRKKPSPTPGPNIR